MTKAKGDDKGYSVCAFHTLLKENSMCTPYT